MDVFSSTQDAGTLLDSFFVEVVRPSDGASVLAVTEQAQEFYLEYAQNHLNDTDHVTITMAKFGEYSFLVTPIKVESFSEENPLIKSLIRTQRSSALIKVHQSQSSDYSQQSQNREYSQQSQNSEYTPQSQDSE